MTLNEAEKRMVCQIEREKFLIRPILGLLRTKSTKIFGEVQRRSLVHSVSSGICSWTV